jgi:predicted dehydrogenase
VTAARAGRALLLEKPLAADLDGARRLAEAIAAAGVPSQMVLTFRYASTVRAFLARAAGILPFGGHAQWISGGLLGGPFATPWRRQRGAILDVGPHMIDLLDAALGPVIEVRGHGNGPGWTGMLLAHEGGAVSELSLCTRAPVQRPVCRVELYGERGSVVADPITVDGETWTTIVREFATTVRQGGGHPLDARHGLRLQEIIQAAERDLAPERAIRSAGRR